MTTHPSTHQQRVASVNDNHAATSTPSRATTAAAHVLGERAVVVRRATEHDDACARHPVAAPTTMCAAAGRQHGVHGAGTRTHGRRAAELTARVREYQHRAAPRGVRSSAVRRAWCERWCGYLAATAPLIVALPLTQKRIEPAWRSTTNHRGTGVMRAGVYSHG